MAMASPAAAAVSQLLVELEVMVRRMRRLFLVARSFACEPLTTATLEWVVKTSRVLRAVRPERDGALEGDEAQEDYARSPLALLPLAVCAAHDAIKDVQVACAAADADAATRDIARFMSAEFALCFPQLLDPRFRVDDRASAREPAARGDKDPPPLRMSDGRWLDCHGEEMGREVLAWYEAKGRKRLLPSEPRPAAGGVATSVDVRSHSAQRTKAR